MEAAMSFRFKKNYGLPRGTQSTMWYYVVRLNAFSLRASLTAELRGSSAKALVTALITNTSLPHYLNQ